MARTFLRWVPPVRRRRGRTDIEWESCIRDAVVDRGLCREIGLILIYKVENGEFLNEEAKKKLKDESNSQNSSTGKMCSTDLVTRWSN